MQCCWYLADISTDSSLTEAISKHSIRSDYVMTATWLQWHLFLEIIRQRYTIS